MAAQANARSVVGPGAIAGTGLGRRVMQPSARPVLRLPTDQHGPRYVRLHALDRELRVIGHELVPIGPGLRASIRRLVETGSLRDPAAEQMGDAA